jgi:sugar transferase (PEP-CTERM/EpsH1 system associated)
VPRLLLLAHRIPIPPDKGEKLRAYHFIAHLAGRFDIRLGCLVDDPADWDGVAALRRLCGEVGAFPIDRRRQRLAALLRARPGRSLMLDYYRSAKLRRWVQGQLAQGVDAALVYTAAMMPYVLGAQLPTLLDMVDVDSEKWAMYARRARGPMRAVWRREARNLLAFERRAASASAVTLLVSKQEAARFAELAPEARERIEWVENGVDLDAFSPTRAWPNPFPDPGPHLVFTGHMDYWPNVDAVQWFAAEVMPRLRARPAAPRFWIVGANPSEAVKRLAALPGVCVTGRVPEVQPYLAHAAACVSPLRMARGIQNKVLEAMAMGRPVVASPQAFEGVRAQAGTHLLVADGAEETARAVTAILDGRHPKLGAAARRAMEEGYAWKATLSRLDAHLTRCLGCSSPPPPAGGGRGEGALGT